MNKLSQLASPAGRVLLASIFVMSGVSKIGAYAGTLGYMEAFGIPGALLPLVIALEIGGGLAIMVGWQTRLVAFALAGFSLISAVIFHANFADQIQMIMFLKNVSMAGAFLFLVSTGPGYFALDNRKVSA